MYVTRLTRWIFRFVDEFLKVVYTTLMPKIYRSIDDFFVCFDLNGVHYAEENSQDRCDEFWINVEENSYNF